MPTVLYVDQDKDYSTYMKAVLPSFGIPCHAVESYSLALQEVASMQYDCIVAEWNNAFAESCELIQNLAQHAEGIPILVVTHKTTERILPHALEAGARSVLGKPFSAQELAHTIAQMTWLRMSSRHPASHLQNQGPA